MKQLGIGTHNMHDTYKHLPSAVCQKELCVDFNEANGISLADAFDWSKPYIYYRVRVAWSGAICAFIEQQARYEQIVAVTKMDAKTGSTGNCIGPYDAVKEKTINGILYQNPYHGVTIPAFVCPSEQLKINSQTIPLINYRGCVGDESYLLSAGNGRDLPTGFRGIFGSGYTNLFDMSSIVDGTSNTLLFSEGACSPNQNAKNLGVLGGVANVNTAADGAGFMYNCLLTRANGGKDLQDSLAVPARQGGRWADAGSGYNLFAAILPPNSPSCVSNATSAGDAVLTSASSYHSGGVNVTLADGSVRFVSDTVNASMPTVSQVGRPLTGKSPYGVWGAMGTRNGGESASL